MSNSKNVKATDKMMGTIKTILEATQVVVDSIDNGKRKQVKEIAEAVALSLQMDPKKVLAYVNDFVHEIPEQGYVSRGKNGGFIKGTRPVKVVKPSVVAAAPSTPVMIDDEEDETV